MTRIESTLEDVSRETSGLGLTPEQLDLFGRYHDALATDGVERGLIGPKEGDKLWSRHLLNCAVVALNRTEMIPVDSTVADIGTGAGLPGIVWAITRPDLRIVLVEPLLRRTLFLEEIVENLGLSERVRVTRSRAEDLEGQLNVDVTTARAVAPFERLLPLLAPLTRPGGQILALKGARAEAELAASLDQVEFLGCSDAEVLECGEGIVNPPTRVIRLRRQSA